MKTRFLIPIIILLFMQVLFLVPAAASTDSCTLTALSIPDGAAISIDGTLIGTVPQEELELPCGNHTIIMSANGYADYIDDVTLEPGIPQAIVANLQRTDDRGSVYITSDPPGGSIFVDGILQQGTTPLLIDALYPGPHAILIRKSGYEDYTDTVTAGPGMIPTYNEFLVPVPQTGFLDVVSSPGNATAYLDGTLFGTTPTLFSSVIAGNHTLIVQKPGYMNYTQTIVVQGGTSGLVQADLEKIPDTGTIIIDSSPDGAALFLNGTYKTMTPANFEGVPAGYYSLDFQKPNYTTQDASFNLTGGETLEIFATLSTDPNDTSKPSLLSYNSGGNDTSAGTDQVFEKTYSWFSRGRAESVTLHIPKSLYYYYKNQTHPTNATALDNYTLSDEDQFYLYDLIGQLKDTSGNQNLAARDDYHTVTAFVQSIPYALHTDPATGQTTTDANDYWKYPVETLVEGNGDCIDDSILAAALLKDMNYDVAIVLLPQVAGRHAGHAIVGVACDNCNGYYYPIDGKKYYYLDLTGPGLSLGQMSYGGEDDAYANTVAEVVVLKGGT